MLTYRALNIQKKKKKYNFWDKKMKLLDPIDSARVPAIAWECNEEKADVGEPPSLEKHFHQNLLRFT